MRACAAGRTHHMDMALITHLITPLRRHQNRLVPRNQIVHPVIAPHQPDLMAQKN